MIGRINSWKGQDVLVHAVATLPPEPRSQIIIKFAGAAFGANEDAKQLKELVAHLNLTQQFELLGFTDDPTPLYQWADLVIVPSKKPEPFGLVAIEAMSHSRPVLAAAHGGLFEIVVDQETGLLFGPGDHIDLADKIGWVLNNKSSARQMGQNGRKRYQDRFTLQRYQTKLSATLDAMWRSEN